jgi:hypothetical protein
MPKNLIEKSMDHLIDHVTAVLQQHKVLPLVVNQQQRSRGASVRKSKTKSISPSSR